LGLFVPERRFLPILGGRSHFFTEQGESRFKELAGDCVSLEYRKLLEQLEKGTLIGKPE